MFLGVLVPAGAKHSGSRLGQGLIHVLGELLVLIGFLFRQFFLGWSVQVDARLPGGLQLPAELLQPILLLLELALELCDLPAAVALLPFQCLLAMRQLDPGGLFALRIQAWRFFR